MKTPTPTSRQRAALKIFNDFGAEYFNPMIVSSAADTCEKLNDALGTLHKLLNGGELSEDLRYGVALFVQTM